MPNPPTGARRILYSFAHPDDEAFGCAGTIKLDHTRGVHTTLVCATKGEAGEISQPELAEPANLGLVRERELRTAAHHMGVDDLLFLGYRDSGMAGSDPNAHPQAFMNAPTSAVANRLVHLIRTRRPHIVVTFDPTGGYGHPDHIAIHRATLAAFHLAADPAYAPDLGEPWQASRLFYPAFDRTVFVRLRDKMVELGHEPPDWGDDAAGIIWPEQSFDARVNIAPVVEDKWAALMSHATQFGPDNPFRKVPRDFLFGILDEECYELAWPAAKPAAPWRDLWDGLTEPTTAAV